MVKVIETTYNPFNTKTGITPSNDTNYRWVYKTYYDVGSATLPLTNLNIKDNKLYYFLIGQGGSGRGVFCGTSAGFRTGNFVGTNFNLNITLGESSKTLNPSITGTYVNLSNSTININNVNPPNGSYSISKRTPDLQLVTFYDGLTNKTNDNSNYDGKYIGGNGGLGGGSNLGNSYGLSSEAGGSNLGNSDGLSSGAGGGGGLGDGTNHSGGIGINGYNGGDSFGNDKRNGGNGGRGFNFPEGGVGGGGGGGGHGEKSKGYGGHGGLGAIMIYYQIRI
jgi:hypothetical protein